jgi:GT2 family glycosyltransferase
LPVPETSNPAGGAQPPSISVVIPTFQRPELLSRCLDHLLVSLNLSGRTDVEVIITDDSADERTRQLVRERYPWAVWVAGPRQGGPAPNRNSGVARSRGRWILFTDDDCLPSPAWVGALVSAISTAGDVRVFEGCTVADREQQRLDEEAPVNTTGGYLWSCNMAIERAVFESMDGFCESLAWLEDIDFRVRLRKAGHDFRFVSDAVVCHPRRPSKGLAFQRISARSYLLLIQRHPELLGESPWRDALFNFARRLRLMLLSALRLRFRGFGFAVGSLAIVTWTELDAILRRPLKVAPP